MGEGELLSFGAEGEETNKRRRATQSVFADEISRTNSSF